MGGVGCERQQEMLCGGKRRQDKARSTSEQEHSTNWITTIQ